MLQYVIYFLAGGTVVALVAYIGSRGNGFLAALVASVPVLFLLNVLLIYRIGGVVSSVTYVKGSLLFLPAFACYAALTVWLLPHLGMPRALLLGLPIYLLPLMIRKVVRPGVSKAKALSRGWLGRIPFLPKNSCDLMSLVSALPFVACLSGNQLTRWLMPELVLTKSAKGVSKGCQPKLQPPESSSRLATE